MHLTVINGYELGQFLRILLWICVPIAMCALLVTTWLQYRRRQTFTEGLLLSMEGTAGEGEAMPPAYHSAGHDETGSGEIKSAEIDSVERVSRETITAGNGGFDQTRDDRVEEPGSRLADSLGEQDYKENLYKGILWMKDKYEQYREMADQRYDRLKDQLTKVERRYEELLSSLEASHPVVGAKPMEPAAGVEAEPGEPIAPTEPVGLEAMFRMEGAPGESIPPAESRPVTEPKAEFAEMTVVDREERTHTQELEQQLARTRQRLEEELGRVRFQLEEEVARSRRKQDEQAAVMETNRHLEQQMVYSNRQLEEKQRIIADLEGQVRSDRQKIEELVTKLRNNSQLLMKIYQELDKSIHFNDLPKEG
jgi:hypothetical protein